jgi:hypothetical protein
MKAKSGDSRGKFVVVFGRVNDVNNASACLGKSLPSVSESRASIRQWKGSRQRRCGQRNGLMLEAGSYSALSSNTTGGGNIALGSQAGINLTAGDNNIDIGNEGVAGEAATIRIGEQGTHSNMFIAGVSGVSVAGGALVAVSSDGQLGTAPAGSGLLQGAYVALPTNSVAPSGFTFLGTTVLKYQYKVGTRTKTAKLTLNLYQKD